MKAPARLSVSDAEGRRSVQVDKPVFIIGSRTSADLQVVSRDVSREHARITCEADQYLIADCGSRFGTFINGEAVVAPRVLLHGDRIRLGQTDVVDLIFLRDDETASGFRGTRVEHHGPQADDRHPERPARARGRSRGRRSADARVDGALEVTTADRGFIMLAAIGDELQFRTRPRARRPGARRVVVHGRARDPARGLRDGAEPCRERPARRRSGGRARRHDRHGHPPRAVCAAVRRHHLVHSRRAQSQPDDRRAVPGRS